MPSSPLAIAASAAFVVALIAAAIGDARTRRIPNRLVIGLALGAAVFHAADGLGASPVLPSVLTAFGVLVGGAGLFAAGWLGAGDAKLAAAVALWLAPAETGLFLLYTAIFGAVFAILHLATPAALPARGPARAAPGAGARSRSLPYAPAIAAGALVAIATERLSWL